MGAHRNPATVCLGAYPLPLLSRAMLPARAYALACAADRAQPAPKRPGYRLYWLADEVLGCREVPADAASFAAVGRHTHCDVVLDRDPTVALRHLLVGAMLLDDGAPVLRILDLHTKTGFELSDGSTQRSVFARGPLVLGVGAYALVALPVGGRWPDRLPPAPRPAAWGQGHPYRMPPLSLLVDPVARPDVRTHLTLMPRALDLGEHPSARGLEPAPPFSYELDLEGARGRARVRVALAELERGVLLGRDGRCADGGLRAVLSDGVSRVHLMLLRVGQQCTAIDLGSTQGTRVDGRPVRSVPLSDGGSRLVLAASPAVQLHFRAVRLD